MCPCIAVSICQPRIIRGNGPHPVIAASVSHSCFRVRVSITEFDFHFADPVGVHHSDSMVGRREP